MRLLLSSYSNIVLNWHGKSKKFPWNVLMFHTVRLFSRYFSFYQNNNLLIPFCITKVGLWCDNNLEQNRPCNHHLAKNTLAPSLFHMTHLVDKYQVYCIQYNTKVGTLLIWPWATFEQKGHQTPDIIVFIKGQQKGY